MAENSYIEVRHTGKIVNVVFDRPEKLNAIHTEFLDELREVLKGLAEDPSEGILFTGMGRATCAGVDKSIVSHSDFETVYSQFRRDLWDMYDLVRSYPYPTVFAARGAAVGAGLILSTNCDFTVIGAETEYSLPEVKMGLHSEKITELLRYQIGANLTREIVLIGDPIDPSRAYNNGLVTSVVPEHQVNEEARRLLERVMENDTQTMEEVKTVLRHSRQPGSD